MTSEESSLKELQGKYKQVGQLVAFNQGLMTGYIEAIADLMASEHGVAIKKVITLLGKGGSALLSEAKRVTRLTAETYAEGRPGIVVLHSLQDLPYFTKIRHCDDKRLTMYATWLVRIDQPGGCLRHVISYLTTFSETEPAGVCSKEVLAALGKFANEAKQETGIEFAIEKMYEGESPTCSS